MKLSAKQFFCLVALAVMPSASAWAAFGRLGAMGDSLTDEYWDSGVSSYATNWTMQVVLFRGIDMGPTAAQAGTNSWGEPRNAGYKYNWARSGATSSTLLTQGQHTGLAAQAGAEGVSNAVLVIGGNDFNPASSSSYLNIYDGFWSAAQIQTYANQILTNIETALFTVRTAGISVVVGNVIDPGSTVAVASALTDGAKRERVAAAIQVVNGGLKNLAQKYQVPLMDWFGLQRAVFGPNTNLHSTLKIGNVTINLRAIDPGPPASAPVNAFVSDGFHPNTILQGVFANLILEAFHEGHNADLVLFSEQELLSHALVSYGGSDTLQSQIGAYTNYIILPVLPRFTGINVAGTNVALTLSTVSNQFYVVEGRDDLVSGSWAVVTNNIAGNGGVVSVTNAVPAGLPHRFYRVRQLP